MLFETEKSFFTYLTSVQQLSHIKDKLAAMQEKMSHITNILAASYTEIHYNGQFVRYMSHRAIYYKFI